MEADLDGCGRIKGSSHTSFCLLRMETSMLFPSSGKEERA